MTATPEAPRTCPYCGETYAGRPRRCPHCEEDLSSAHADETVQGIVDGTLEEAATGTFRPPAREGPFRRWRVSTIVWACILAASIAAAATGSPAVEVIGVIAGLLALGFLLTLGIQDLMLKDPAAVADPLAFARNWTKCLREKRWGTALRATLPAGRTLRRLRPAHKDLFLTESTRMDLSSEKGVRDAWRPVLHPDGSGLRRGTFSEYSAENLGRDDAMVTCILEVVSYPRWVPITILVGLIVPVILYYVLRKRVHVPVVLRMLRLKGRWYIVDGSPVIGLAQGDG